jgi:hypothetical protein
MRHPKYNCAVTRAAMLITIAMIRWTLDGPGVEIVRRH